MSNDRFLMDMGTRIAQRRKELRLTQEQLAELVGISLQTVSNIELGKKAVRPENLANLCLCLGVSSDHILYGKRDMAQMTDTVEKLAALDSQAYQTVEQLIRILHDRSLPKVIPEM